MVLPSSVWGLLSCYFLCSWAGRSPRLLHSLPALSPPIKPGSVPMWASPKRMEAALAFFYSGDAQQLMGANCSKRYVAWGARTSPGIPPLLQGAAGILAQAANFLNMLLQANDIRESSMEEDMEWYQALVRSLAEGDPRTYRVLLTFNPPPGGSHLPLALQATRSGDETILEDLSQKTMQEQGPTGTPDIPPLQKRVLTNDLQSLGSPKWPRAEGFVGDTQHVKLSIPFLECQEGRLRPGWLVTLSVAFYGLKPDLSPEARGQVQMDLDLQSMDINQCARGPGWFANTHLCDLNSTQCIPLKSQGFVLGRYICRCRPGFYGANTSGGPDQPAVQFGSPQGSSGRLLRCLPCAEGCTSCMDATPCLVEEDLALRTAVLACQSCCMLAVFLGMVLSYRCRQSKKIRASGVVLLETILFGSLLLYFPVFILYFQPSVFRCIALRWVRLLGFVTVYGSITLRLHRVLQLFLFPMAQRGTPLSRGRLVWRLGLLLLPVLAFLAVWTAGVLGQDSQHMSLVIRGHTPAGRHFYLCHQDRWDYIMVVAEVSLLCWGSFLCYATRAVPSAFHEPRYLGIALHNDLLFSTTFHAARFALGPSLHPDWMLLLFFLHTHGTVTTTLALIFIPKLRKPGAPSREEMVDDELEDELDLQRSGSYLDSSLASAWSERSLDPGDIKDELKKLYAQLEVHKTKEMAANNPHLPKKQRSSHQGLGRSFMRCLAEFPQALARQYSGSSSHRSLPGSSCRRLLSSSLQEAEGSPVLHKFPGTYEQELGREQEPVLQDSLLRRKLATKASRLSRESAEGPPVLGFRSASAHNLTVCEKSPRARPASLQKSLSVVTGSQEKALLVASQAHLEEMYRQAKEQEKRRAERVGASPSRRPSTRRLEPAQRAPLSAPPTPAKSCSADSPQILGKLPENPGKRLPYPHIQHQVSRPSLGEPQRLSPSATWLTPGPSQNPSLLICPWENAELPVKKEKVAQEDNPGQDQDTPSHGPARAKLWRALSVAVERKAAAENAQDPEDGQFQGVTEDGDSDRPKIFSKSHSLRGPLQPGSMHSLGLALKALTRSRSTYRDKKSVMDSPELGERARALDEGARVCPKSPRQGWPKGVSKQAAVVPTDEESLQNQQNAHTSQRLWRQQLSGGDQDMGQVSGEGKVQGRVITAPLGSSLERAGTQQSLAEICPWEVLEGPDPQQPQSKADICPWEEQEEGAERGAGRRAPEDSQKAKVGSLGKPEPHGDVGVPAWKGPEGPLMLPGTVCPWDHMDLGDLSPQPTVGDRDRSQGRSMAVGSGEAKQEGWGGRDAVTPSLPTAKFWLGGSGKGEGGQPSQEVGKEISQERQRHPKPVSSWEGQRLGRVMGAAYPQERTDFRGPLAVPPEGCLESVGWGIAAPCPQEAEKAELRPRVLVDKVVTREQPSQGPAIDCPMNRGSFGEVGQQVEKPGHKPLLQQESGHPWETTAPGSSSPCPDYAWAKAGDPLPHKQRALPKSPGEGARIPGKEVGLVTTETGPCAKRVTAREACTLGEFPKEEEEKMQGTPRVEESPIWEKPAGGALGPGSVSSLPGEGPIALSQMPPEKTTISPCKGSAGVGQESALGVEAFGRPTREIAPVAESSPKAEAAMRAAYQETKQPGQEHSEMLGPQQNLHPGGALQHPNMQDKGGPKDNFRGLDHTGYRPVEVCPGEEEDKPTGGNAQICPWEATERIPGKGGPRVYGKWESGEAPEKPQPRLMAIQEKPEKLQAVGKQEAVGAPDIQDWGNLSPPPSSYDYETVGSVRTRAAQACPWEAEEVPSTEKVEVGPLEGRRGTESCQLEVEAGRVSPGPGEISLQKAAASKETGECFPEQAAKLSKEQQAACPGEGEPMLEPHAQDTDQLEASPDPARSLESKMAEPCQWEITDPEGNQVRGSMVDICPWEGAETSQAEPDLLAFAATPTEILPLPAPENPLRLLVHQPPSSSLPKSKSSFPGGIKPVSTNTVQDGKECPGPSELEPKTSSASQLMPQESQVPKPPLLPGDQGEASKCQHEESKSPCE